MRPRDFRCENAAAAATSRTPAITSNCWRTPVRALGFLHDRDQRRAGGGGELVARYDVRVPRYTSYPTAPHFSPAVGASIYARWLADLPAETPPSLYLHVPFCDRLCLYCGCNTSVVRLESSHRAYAALLMREIDHVARLIGRRAAVSHVHWGGGAPTSLPGDCLVAIMDRLKERFAFAKDAEIAIEIDPTSLPSDRREALGPMGVTRVSLGVQDVEFSVQRAIGRVQSHKETKACAV